MTFFDTVLEVLKEDKRFFTDDGVLLRNAVYEAAMQMDAKLITALYERAETRERFFTDVNGIAVFDKVGFGWVINNRQFLPDSYTRFKNKIGLVDGKSNFVATSDDVELVFPYKDCVLEGGQTKEDQKRTEIFYNETLAPDEVDRLLYPKVFTNAKRYTQQGIEENIRKFNESDNLIIKGNNLLAISSILSRYEGKVKMIYIDAIVNKALCQFGIFKFNVLQQYFPNLKSTHEFIMSREYLGDIQLEIVTPYEKPNGNVLYAACISALSKIGESISSIEVTYEGSKEFKAHYIHDVFKDKTCSYTAPHDGGVGISQNDASVPAAWKLDLSQEDWFAFEDNYGTSEEKAFVAYFKTYVGTLKEKYDKVFLIRNERQLHIYSFTDGERFEPDYVLFLHTPTDTGYEQLQVFIEPKGAHLIENDKWKEDFLLELESKAIPVVKLADDNKYKIWGFHFFNLNEREAEIRADFKKL